MTTRTRPSKGTLEWMRAIKEIDRLIRILATKDFGPSGGMRRQAILRKIDQLRDETDTHGEPSGRAWDSYRTKLFSGNPL